MLPKQTKSTLKGVLGMMDRYCRIPPMLARTIAWVCGCAMITSGGYAEGLKPNILVLLVEPESRGKEQTRAREILDELLLKADDKSTALAWRGCQGDCRSSAKLFVLPALLYGKQPLVNGVVHYQDWRRIPVAGDSIAAEFKKAGYHTAFYGGWKMGKSAPYDPQSRGFEEAYDLMYSTPADKWGRLEYSSTPRKLIPAAIVKAMGGEKPVFGIIEQSFKLNPLKLVSLLKAQALSEMEKTKRPTIIFMMRATVSYPIGLSDDHKETYHSPVSWRLYHYGLKSGYLVGENAIKSSQTDWELHAGLRKLIGKVDEEKIEFRFFNNTLWPANESADKHRHQGSLVVGKGYALVDGLELYPANKNLEPDLTKPLDIAENQKLHSELLLAHANWWKKARQSLRDTRAFSVGVEDKKPTQLTIVDWRPSKIIYPDGASPMYKPLTSQKDLLGILKGMQSKEYRQDFPPYSGSWSVNVIRAGRYKITASLLPKEATKPEEKTLARLLGGQAFFKLGRNKVQLNLVKGASAVSVLVDADAGVTDLECWFTGQLALERELGAFFVEIERVGDKKFDLKAKE
jgi:hypothetical protein